MGEVPPIECWPELWIINDNDEALANKYLASDPLGEKVLAEWKCENCGERSEGQFTDCWSCGKQQYNEEE